MFIYYFVWFLFIFSFYLTIGQLISLYFSWRGLLVVRFNACLGTWGVYVDCYRNFGDFIARDNILFDFQSLPGSRCSYPVLFWGCHLLKKLLPSISSNLAMAFPSLIRNLISSSISEQSVGNCSKRFETHLTNGPIYPQPWEIFRISEQMWRNPFRNRRGFSRFWCWSFSGWLHEFMIFGMDLIHLLMYK